MWVAWDGTLAVIWIELYYFNWSSYCQVISSILRCMIASHQSSPSLNCLLHFDAFHYLVWFFVRWLVFMCSYGWNFIDAGAYWTVPSLNSFSSLYEHLHICKSFVFSYHSFEHFKIQLNKQIKPNVSRLFFYAVRSARLFTSLKCVRNDFNFISTLCDGLSKREFEQKIPHDPNLKLLGLILYRPQKNIQEVPSFLFEKRGVLQ